MAAAGSSPLEVDRDKEQDLTEIARDYSQYLKIDVAKERKNLEDSIEDMLQRLDEFVVLIDMVRSDNTQCLNRTLPDIYAKTQEMEKTFQKIDKLEVFIQLVKQNINDLEDKVAKAEQDFNGGSSLSKAFRPFLKKKQDGDKVVPKYEPAEIFNTADYFSDSKSSRELLPSSAEYAVEFIPTESDVVHSEEAD